MDLRHAIDYYRQDLDSPNRDLVRVHLVTMLDGQPIGGRDVELSNAALEARAILAGRSTWDETDVEALMAERLAVAVVLAAPAIVEMLPVEEHPDRTDPSPESTAPGAP